MESRVRPRVGLRIALTVLWTIVLVAGATLGVLLAAPGLAESVQRGLTTTVALTGVAAAVAVGMILIGLWGIASSHRHLQLAMDLIAESDRARKEAIQLEGSRLQRPPR
jgi:quinol-cytochrome oxidoreductase complex cytochrome b subunit